MASKNNRNKDRANVQ